MNIILLPRLLLTALITLMASLVNRCVQAKRSRYKSTIILPILLSSILMNRFGMPSSFAQEYVPTKTPTRNAALCSVRLIVNGKHRGKVMVLPFTATSDEAGIAPHARVMIPVRAVVESIGWKVDTSVETLPDIAGRWVELIAPYTIQVSHQDMAPAEFVEERSPHIVIQVKTGYVGIMCPDWEMGEAFESKSLPEIINQRVYLPLDLLADALERIARRLGETTAFSQVPSGATNKVGLNTGVLMSYMPEEKELHIRYIPGKIETEWKRAHATTTP